MDGIIHAEFREFVERSLGAQAWRELCAEARLPRTVYFVSEHYPDEELLAGLVAAARITGRPMQELLTDFGRSVAAGLLSTYGAFVSPRWRTLDLVEHTEAVIHKAVRLNRPDAAPPRLRTERTSPDEVRVIYASERRLCSLAEGIIAGVADHFGEAVEISQASCMHRGDELCELVVTKA